jgi:hypothetical protein
MSITSIGLSVGGHEFEVTALRRHPEEGILGWRTDIYETSADWLDWPDDDTDHETAALAIAAAVRVIIETVDDMDESGFDSPE